MPLSYRFGLLILAASLLTLFGLSIAVHEMREEQQMFNWERNLVNQINYWSTLMASSEEPGPMAEDISNHFGVSIRLVLRNGKTLTTDENMPSINELTRLRPISLRFTRNFPPSLVLYNRAGTHYLVHKTPKAAFIYRHEGNNLSWLDHAKFAGGVFIYLALLFGTVMYLIRRMLNPLSKVASEMEIFACQGILSPPDQPVSNEVISVATSFGRMRTRVENLLASKETLLRDVSHEIRSPLARMRLRLEFIDDAAIQEQMGQDIRLIDNLAGELLDRALLDAGSTLPPFEQVDLAELVRANSATFTTNQQYFTLDLPPTAVLVHGNARLLHRCLHNLLTNSLNYSTLSLESIRINLSSNGDMVQLTVADQGTQLDEQVVAHLFEPFWRPDNSRTKSTGGHGLGLSLVAAIAQAHGGTAVATSPPTGGLVVNVSVPLA